MQYSIQEQQCLAKNGKKRSSNVSAIADIYNKSRSYLLPYKWKHYGMGEIDISMFFSVIDGSHTNSFFL